MHCKTCGRRKAAWKLYDSERAAARMSATGSAAPGARGVFDNMGEPEYAVGRAARLGGKSASPSAIHDADNNDVLASDCEVDRCSTLKANHPNNGTNVISCSPAVRSKCERFTGIEESIHEASGVLWIKPQCQMIFDFSDVL